MSPWITLMTLKEGNRRSERENGEKTSTIDAYGERDTHIDEASGYRDIDDFPNQQKICEECGMVARNEGELQVHVRSAHAT